MYWSIIFRLNPIFSLIFNQIVPIGFDIAIDAINYWFEWLMHYEWITIMLALVGLVLIIKSCRYFKRDYTK